MLNLPTFLSRLSELFKFDFKFYLGSPSCPPQTQKPQI
ncbi:hypothetical protein CSUNSWCD_1263 [Campylobacter showae CSUNSWCD]|uniref:Uncharacterized protein n=1 Tax=Campylobacter showae CSUNSWCD TaxID=1244083 RepID=M5IR71_9BACT|nr:hypothetical protein CSUNSWCD_1263 [Campylobacter showae CSUNSWCD]